MREAKKCPKCDVELRNERFCSICGWRQGVQEFKGSRVQGGVAGKAEELISAQPKPHFIVHSKDVVSLGGPEEVRECKCCGKQITIRGGSAIFSAFFEYKPEEAVFCSQICFVKFIARQEAVKVVLDSKNANWVTLLDISNDKQPKLYITDEGELKE